jgi:hypothetical protein
LGLRVSKEKKAKRETKEILGLSVQWVHGEKKVNKVYEEFPVL